jgi:hypothetical protein
VISGVGFGVSFVVVAGDLAMRGIDAMAVRSSSRERTL